MEDLVMSAKFWRGKKIFLTGDSGFKGGWLAYSLHILGAQVTGFSNEAAYDPTFFKALRLGELYESLRGDIRDSKSVSDAMSNAKPDIVFHLAAQPLVRLSYREPLETFTTNVIGTANTLDACRKQESLGAIVNVTTDKVYENRELTRGYSEQEALGGFDPYSSSKVCAEVVAKCYRQSYFQNKKLVSVRAGNIFGGGDWSEDRLIPDAVRAFSNGLKLKIRHPRAIRPWQHVIDPLRGYLRTAELAYTGQIGSVGAVNLGPAAEQCVPVERLLTSLAGKWGGSASWEIESAEDAVKETQTLMLDSSLAFQILKWKTELNLESAVSETVDWYKAFVSGGSSADLRSLTKAQLDKWGVLA